jgi:surface antigen
MSAGGLSCVPYVRQRTGAALYGDAYSWWDNAAGLYPRGDAPQPGAILVLRQSARLASGHVAVVSRVMGPRQILVDHANWIPGEVAMNMPVIDVSPGNDWSELRFWYQPAGTFGAVYPAAGFIYANGAAPSTSVSGAPNQSGPNHDPDQTVIISGNGVSIGSQ